MSTILHLWCSFVLGAASLPLVVTYPLMKRVTFWPQLYLGGSSLQLHDPGPPCGLNLCSCATVCHGSHPWSTMHVLLCRAHYELGSTVGLGCSEGQLRLGSVSATLCVSSAVDNYIWHHLCISGEPVYHLLLKVCLPLVYIHMHTFTQDCIMMVCAHVWLYIGAQQLEWVLVGVYTRIRILCVHRILKVTGGVERNQLLYCLDMRELSCGWLALQAAWSVALHWWATVQVTRGRTLRLLQHVQPIWHGRWGMGIRWWVLDRACII